MNSSRMRIGLTILVFAALVAACDEPREVMKDTQMVALQGATRAEVGLHMNAGELRVRGADQEALLEAAFEYNRDRDRPVVEYRRLGDKGTLQVRRARRNSIPFGRVRNRWDLILSTAVPIDLDIDLGAGQSDIDLRGLKLERVKLDMGVGEMTLDLQGPHQESFNVKIDGGVGSGKIYLPSEVGVRVKVDGGLGSIEAHGLTKQGGSYVNEADGKSAVAIEIEIDAGIGSLDLRVESPARTKI
ncbi:MAG: toast rack family protein [Candidatus Aminicenantes bacterium]|nr:toast rack family protein [Candidatus Aminicenantes bacterium]